uniref:Uncharacterized protein n=1 Tax=Caldiarchaeum subterraneum TaxID=311458 RepID=A0A7J3VT08_CALS0
MRRKAITPASVILFSLTVVLLAVTATYLSVATYVNVQAGNRLGLEASQRSKHELRLTLLPGLPPGKSPKAWLVIHEEHGVGTLVTDMILDKNGAIIHRTVGERLDEGRCIAVRLERLGLPRSIRDYDNSTLVVHAVSGAVGKAFKRTLNPDAVYPCRIDPPVRHGNFTVNIQVTLEDADGGRRPCGSCRHSVSPQPGSHMSQPHKIMNLTAAHNVTVSGSLYVFSHWEISFTPPQEQPVTFTENPLPLFVDDHYHVDAVYKKQEG